MWSLTAHRRLNFGCTPPAIIVMPSTGSNLPAENGAEYLAPAQFAELSGLSLSTVHRYLAKGRLPKFQPGGQRCRVLIPRSALDLASTPESDNSPPATESTSPAAGKASKTDLPGPPPRWRGKAKQ